MDLPAGTSVFGFADDALVARAADDVKILELRINDSLWRAKRWLDSRCLKMTPEKTETLLVTDRRSFKYPRIVLEEHEIKWKKSIKFLGVQLDPADRDCQSHPMWGRPDSALAQHWWTQGS